MFFLSKKDSVPNGLSAPITSSVPAVAPISSYAIIDFFGTHFPPGTKRSHEINLPMDQFVLVTVSTIIDDGLSSN